MTLAGSGQRALHDDGRDRRGAWLQTGRTTTSTPSQGPGRHRVVRLFVRYHPVTGHDAGNDFNSLQCQANEPPWPADFETITTKMSNFRKILAFRNRSGHLQAPRMRWLRTLKHGRGARWEIPDKQKPAPCWTRAFKVRRQPRASLRDRLLPTMRKKSRITSSAMITRIRVNTRSGAIVIPSLVSTGASSLTAIAST